MTSLIPTLEGKTYNSGHIHLETDRTMLKMTKAERKSHMLCIITPKYALKTILKNFKERGKVSVTKELTQLHALETFTPVE